MEDYVKMHREMINNENIMPGYTKNFSAESLKKYLGENSNFKNKPREFYARLLNNYLGMEALEERPNKLGVPRGCENGAI